MNKHVLLSWVCSGARISAPGVLDTTDLATINLNGTALTWHDAVRATSSLPTSSRRELPERYPRIR